ncbi:MAG: PA14 domain-containing protein [Verrucomicrobiota bacterium]
MKISLNCYLIASLMLFAGNLLRADFFSDLKTGQVESTPLVEWQHFGPGMSGYIDMFWIHDTDPNAMFDSLDMGNSQGTWDGGQTWESIKPYDDEDTVLDAITYVEFSHQNPNFGLLLDKSGIYSTNDRGRTWSFLVDADTTNSEKHNVMTVDPNNDNIWYIGAGQGWQIKHTHHTKNGMVVSSDRNHSEGYILKSTNKGQSWTKISSPFPADADFSNIIVNPGNSNHVYASCQYGVYRSTNKGNSWSKVAGTGLPNHRPRDMDFYYNATTGEFLLYIVEVTHYQPAGSSISTSGGVYRSSDGGANWTNLTGNLGIDLNKVNSWGYRNHYYRAIAHYLQISQSAAESNYPNLPTDTFSQFSGIEVDPNNKNRIYLVHNTKHDYAFPPGNIWMTSNGGTSWIAAAREGPYWGNETDKAYWQSRGNPLGINTVFAHVEREHNGTTDNVRTGPRFLAINSNSEVYTAFAQQVMKSSDNGATWVQVDDDETSPGSGHWVGRGNSNLPGETLNLDTGTPGIYLFGSGEHGLWRTTNDGGLVYPGAIAVEQLAGQSTSNIDALSISTIAVHPTNKNRIYTLQFRQTQRGSLRYSPDGGASWQTLSTPVNFPAANDVIKQRSLLIDPSNPSIMYFCVPISEIAYWSSTQWVANAPSSFNAFGVYKSTNGGASWSRVNSGLPSNKSVYRLTMDPSNPQVLYAASNQTHTLVDGGLFRSNNRGASWSSVNLPAGVRSVQEVHIEDATGKIYIATGTYSSDGSTGGVWVSNNGGNSWSLLFDMPHVRHIDVSAVDPNVMVVNVGPERSIGRRNPGLYVSVDGGVSWSKINRKIGQKGRITNVQTDPYNADVIWCSVLGTGFFRADISKLRNESPALAYRYYHGTWNSLPDFDLLTPEKVGSVSNFDLAPRTQNDNFGFVFEGKIDVPATGSWTFYTTSDDGSQLFINGTRVVNNDGLHGARERSGSISLNAGVHDIKVTYFEKGGGEILQARWAGPGVSKARIPDTAFVSSGFVSGATREYWTGVSGSSVNSIPLNTDPFGIDTLDRLEAVSWNNPSVTKNWANSYGQRISGYIRAPSTGSYTFWVASDDNSEFYLSTDATPANATLRASVGAWVSQYQWDKFASQKSTPVALEAGKLYYFEVLQKENGGGDHVSVGWARPGESTAAPSEVVPGDYLATAPGAIGGADLGILIQAEAFDSQQGVQVVGGSKVGYVNNGDWIRFADMEIVGATTFTASVASPMSGGTIEIRSGSATGSLLGTASVGNTGGWNSFVPVTATISSASATADLFLVFKGGSGFLFDIDSIQFD